METTLALPVGSVWRDPEDGYLVRIVGHGQNGWPIVRRANGRASQTAWEVNPAWFKRWERTS